MRALLIGAACLGWLGVVTFALALCRAAATGDRALETMACWDDSEPEDAA